MLRSGCLACLGFPKGCPIIARLVFLKQILRFLSRPSRAKLSMQDIWIMLWALATMRLGWCGGKEAASLRDHRHNTTFQISHSGVGYQMLDQPWKAIHILRL